MPADTMNPATAVTWATFIQAAEAQFTMNPGEVNPAIIMNMPAGYTLVRTIQMTDVFGPAQSRVFYGFVAVGGNPETAVVALRGTATGMEWWDDLDWDLVSFTQVPGGGKVAAGFYGIYATFGIMTPGQRQSTAAPGTFAADVAQAATEGLGGEVDPADLPIVVTGHSLGGALATLLVADLTANTVLNPQAWTFASPKTGDAAFAARYRALSTVSWRIYNQVDVVPYFPVGIPDRYRAVTTGYAINSLGKAQWSLSCAHRLNTYMHVLSPTTAPLDRACNGEFGAQFHESPVAASADYGRAEGSEPEVAGLSAYSRGGSDVPETDIRDIAKRFSELGQIQVLLTLDDIWTSYLLQAHQGEVPYPDFEGLQYLADRMSEAIPAVATAAQRTARQISAIPPDVFQDGLNNLLERGVISQEVVRWWSQSEEVTMTDAVLNACDVVVSGAGEELQILIGKRARLESGQLPDPDLSPFFRCALWGVGVGIVGAVAGVSVVGVVGAGVVGVGSAVVGGAATFGVSLAQSWERTGCPEAGQRLFRRRPVPRPVPAAPN